jgi:hypothetical protein
MIRPAAELPVLPLADLSMRALPMGENEIHVGIRENERDGTGVDTHLPESGTYDARTAAAGTIPYQQLGYPV